MSGVQKYCLGYIAVTILLVIGLNIQGCVKKSEAQAAQPPKQDETLPRFDVSFSFNGKVISEVCRAQKTDCGIDLQECDDGYGYACIHGIQYKFHGEAK